MNSQDQNVYPAFSSIKSGNENPEYPSLSKLSVKESAGDMTYNAQGSKIQNNTIRKDVNYYMIGNSSNSMYDERYDSNKDKNYVPAQPIPNHQNYNNNLNGSDKYNERYDSNQIKNNNVPYPQQMPPNQKVKYNNKEPNCPYNSKDINARPPAYPRNVIPAGNRMPVQPVVYPVPRVVGTYIPTPEEMVEDMYQMGGPGFYPAPYPPPDFYPY